MLHVNLFPFWSSVLQTQLKRKLHENYHVLKVHVCYKNEANLNIEYSKEHHCDKMV